MVVVDTLIKLKTWPPPPIGHSLQNNLHIIVEFYNNSNSTGYSRKDKLLRFLSIVTKMEDWKIFMPPMECEYDSNTPYGAWCEMDRRRSDEFSAQVEILKRMKKDNTGRTDSAFTSLRVLRPTLVGDDPIFQADEELNDMINDLDDMDKISENGFQALLNLLSEQKHQQQCYSHNSSSRNNS